MKRFVINLLTYCLLLIAILAVIVAVDYHLLGNQYEQGYNASILDKMDRLETINTPKIILVGNSNVSFGIRSNLIEEAFNMPVVNLGLHGGLGNAFHENMAKQNIRKRDIIIICHSDYGDDGSLNTPSAAWITLEWHKEFWTLIPEGNTFQWWSAFPNYIKDCYVLKLTGNGNADSGDCYSRKAFNSYGDNTFSQSHDAAFKFKDSYISPVPKLSDECISRINTFNKYAADRGATLFIAGYPIAYDKELINTDEFDRFQSKLEDSMDCIVISNYKDYLFQYKYFYDTTLHLNNEGAIIRTKQLIDDLRTALPLVSE